MENINLEVRNEGNWAILAISGRFKAAHKSFVLCGVDGFVKDMLQDSNMDVLVDIYATTRQLP